MLRKIKKFLLTVIVWFILLSVGLVVLYRFVPVPFTPLMVSRSFEFDVESQHDWVPIEEISPNLQKAVIAAEDATFLSHHGFDFSAMYKAFKNNNKGKKIKGGSTISQQTAKNVFLWQGRSYVRKIFEAYFTALIELLWSKERIMEVYLNSIEMGKGVYGAEAASQYWYKKAAENLTKREAAGIAAILPNPIKYKAANSSSYINRRKVRIMRHMRYVKLEY